MEKRTKISLCITISGVVVLILGVLLGWVVLPFVIKLMIDKVLNTYGSDLIRHFAVVLIVLNTEFGRTKCSKILNILNKNVQKRPK